MAIAEDDVCRACGRTWPEHRTDLQFGMPDEVLEHLDEVVDESAWMSGATPVDSDLLLLSLFGQYVRALVPVRVEGGGILTYSVRVKVDNETFEHIRSAWPTSEHGTIRALGVLANKLPFEHAIYADITVQVVDPNQKPVISSSSDNWTQELLETVLPHSLIE